MSGSGMNIAVADRKFQIGSHGRWPMGTLVKFASEVKNLKGNPMDPEKIQLNHGAIAAIKGEDVAIKRVI